MKIVYADAFTAESDKIEEIFANFEKKGRPLDNGDRNAIKIFDLNGKSINVKSFKIPNFINKIAYRFFRKSKAARSFNYAEYLLSREIGTPYPIAYAEECKTFTFGKSFYVCDQLDYDLRYRDLVEDPDYPDHENILRAFTRFTYDLHEKNIEFLDHSAGNTLIVKKEDHYDFFLVDLNRMKFRRLNFEARMKNFCRLTPKKEMVKIMANEYALLTGWAEAEVFERMWFYTEQFQEKFARKRRMKNRLKFKF